MRAPRGFIVAGVVALAGSLATSAPAARPEPSRAPAFAKAPTAVTAASGSDRVGVYGGQTRADDPLVLWTNAKGSKLTGAAFTFTVYCPSGNGWPVFGDAAVRPMPSGDGIPTDVLLATVNTKRRFELTLLKPLPAIEPYGVMATVIFAGTRDSRSARGTVMATVTVTDTTTAELVEAGTIGPVKWTATRRPGRVYGGISRQHQPVVLTLNAKRSKVDVLRFGWFTGDCTEPAMFMNYGDALFNFRLRNGRFGDAFSDVFPRDDGGSNTWAYDIDGKVGKRKASGSYSATVTYGDPDGTEATCSLPTTRWSATSR